MTNRKEIWDGLTMVFVGLIVGVFGFGVAGDDPWFVVGMGVGALIAAVSICREVSMLGEKKRFH